MLKLGKKSWLVIAIGVFIIALFGLWSVYSQQLGRKEPLVVELNTAEMKLSGFDIEPLTRRHDELEWQLDQTRSQSTAARDMLAQPVDSITVSDHLFEVAAAHSVNITALSSSGMAEEALAGITLPLLPLSATATGNITDLASFITTLNSDFPTGVIRSVDMNNPATGEPATITIQMVIFTYQGADDG
jgi:hypothetical protein